jgi:DNA-binding HxlR family transcriptional regulator
MLAGMRRTSFAGMQCSVARTLEVVGEWWTILILRSAFSGVRRFDDFQRSLGIARNVLADRLQTLVDNGILERRRYQERPERYEYRLTERGRDLYSVVISLLRWGDRWAMDDQPGPPVILTHSCGHDITPEFSCPSCGEAIAPRAMRWRYADHVPTDQRVVVGGLAEGGSARS